MIARRRWQSFIFSFIMIMASLAGTALAVPLNHIAQNVKTDFSSKISYPSYPKETTFIHPLSSVIGNVTLGKEIMVSPCASVRGDEGQPIFVGDGSNIQDGVVLHGLETEEKDEHGEWEYVHDRQFNAAGQRVSNGSGYSVYIGEEVSLAHQVQIHGPAYVGDNTFIAMQSLIFNAKVGSHCVVEPGCVIVGVSIPDHTYVTAGTTITSQVVADALPTFSEESDYTYKSTNEKVVHVNKALAKGYLTVNGPLNHIACNVLTDFSSHVYYPSYPHSTFIHPLASVIGHVTLGEEIMVSPCASVRGDEGQPIYVGDHSNIQDGVVLHGLETEEEIAPEEWEYVHNRQYNAAGQPVSDGTGYSVYIGEEVSLAHQSQVHGPAYVGDNTFIAMQSLIFNAKVGSHCVVEPGCVIVGVSIPDHTYVTAGTTITSQAVADALPTFSEESDYTYKSTNEKVVHVNKELAEGYLEYVEVHGDINHIAGNVFTDFSSQVFNPSYPNDSTFIHPLASVIGNVTLGEEIMVSPCASVRGDEGQPIYVGDHSNIQDGVVLHGLETEEEIAPGEWGYVHDRQFDPNGQPVSDGTGYSVYIGEEVSLAHQVQIHGPAYVGDNTFIAMQSLIFNAKVGSHCVVEPGCVIVGVSIPDHTYVTAGTTITSQEVADALPTFSEDSDYTYKSTNEKVVHVNEALAAGYIKATQKKAQGPVYYTYIPNSPMTLSSFWPTPVQNIHNFFTFQPTWSSYQNIFTCYQNLNYLDFYLNIIRFNPFLNPYFGLGHWNNPRFY